MNSLLINGTRDALDGFELWLNHFGETSQDHQDFYAGRIGRAAKALYYRNKWAGTIAVAPMVFCEAFIPNARRLFFGRMRLPIADAHYAMGFALRFRSSGSQDHYLKAVHFLGVLNRTRCPGYKLAGWGYPFVWQTRNGIIEKDTPLVTTTPYCYEAYEYVYRIDGKQEWREMMRSIAEHILLDYGDFACGENAASCCYTPHGEPGVVNASAYRAFVLLSAAKEFNDERYSDTAERNLRFVFQSQNPNGSWPYAIDGSRHFVDHFHTCFVLKALAKIDAIYSNSEAKSALERGVHYYLMNLFDENGLPKPFAKAPRMTVYKRELYDFAECLNLCVLLRNRFSQLEQKMEIVLSDLLKHWVKPDGSFRSRKLLFGYDNVPMHRWGQSEIFRSLSLLLAKENGSENIQPN
jgi:hypothetical protein